MKLREFDVLARVRVLRDDNIDDPMGVQAATCVRFLPFMLAQEFLKPGVTRKEWDETRLPLTRDAVLDSMHGFYPGAWEIVNQASETKSMITIWSYQALCWLLGSDLDRAFGRTLFYGWRHFGKPALVRIGERYDMTDWILFDDDRWQTEHGPTLPAKTALEAWEREFPIHGDRRRGEPS